MKRTLPLLCATLISIVAGCGIFSSNRLESGGAYAPIPIVTTNATGTVTNQIRPDYALFVIDSAFGLADSSIKFISKLEQDNRAYLFKTNPTIKHKLDALRPQAWKAEQDYIKARKAYLAHPTTDDLNSIRGISQKMQQLSSAFRTTLPTPP